MSEIWTDENKWSEILKIELLICEAHEAAGTIPAGTSQAIAAKASINIARISELDAEVGHDVIAFLTSISEQVGDVGKYLHFGVTSSDVLDTCFSIQLRSSCKLLMSGLEALMAAVKTRAIETKNIICVGRTHGMYAEFTTIGLKFARMYAELRRGLNRLISATDEISVCAISGAVGTYSTISPTVENYVAKGLDLKVEDISSQVIARDRHANLFVTMAIIGSSIENIVTEFRHLQRSEVNEVTEPFSKKQKGSSAMPHKRNPILGENLTGLARVLRSYAVPALENITLWHERDISHSSVERIIAPDACILLDFAIHRLTTLVTGLAINHEEISKRVDGAECLLASQRLLLLLIKRGMSREEAYSLVQECCFGDNLKSSAIKRAELSNQEALSVFISPSVDVDHIFDRVFG